MNNLCVGDIVRFYYNQQIYIGKITRIDRYDDTCSVLSGTDIAFSFMPFDMLTPVLTVKQMDEMVAI